VQLPASRCDRHKAEYLTVQMVRRVVIALPAYASKQRRHTASMLWRISVSVVPTRILDQIVQYLTQDR
jgi:hypothetical protein